MEYLILPSVGGSLKKWVYCAVHPFYQKPWPIRQTFNKKFGKKFKNSKKNGTKPTLSRRRPAASRRLLVTNRPRVYAWTGSACPFFLNFFFALPSTFGASGQLLLVGSSTCPPCPEFTLKLQTPITFEP
jgi:hypothetical protein